MLRGRGIIERWKSAPVEAKASVAYFVCSVMQRGLSLITLPLFTRLLSKVEYGQSTIYASWESLLAILITLNLGYGSFSTAMAKYEGERRRYLAAVDGLVVTLAGLFIVVYLPLRRLLNPIFELPTWIMLLMVAQIVGSSSLHCWYSMQRFEFRYRSVVGTTLGISLSGVVLAIAMVLSAGEGARGYARILGTALPTVTVGLLMVLRFTIREHVAFDRQFWGWALSFNLPLVPYYISQMLFNQSDRIMISHLVGTAEAATYGVAYSIGMLMTFVLNAINGAYVPWFYGRIKAGELRDNRQVATGIALLMAALLTMVIAVAPELIYVMASDKYADACWCVAPVAMSLIFHFYSQLFVNVQFYYEEKWLLVAGTAVAGLLNVLLNWLLLPRLGYVAAAYTTLLSFFLMATGNWLMYRIVLKKQMINDEMFDYPMMIGIASGVVILGHILMLFYKQPIARYGLVGLIICIILMNMNRIRTILQSVKEVRRDA